MPSEGSTISFKEVAAVDAFPTPIWIIDVERNISQPLIDSMIKKLREILDFNIFEYEGKDFQTRHDIYNLDEFKLLSNTVTKISNVAIQQQLKLNTPNVFITGMWANINPPGAITEVHSHPNQYFSGIFYVKCEKNSGDTRFFDPRPQAEVISQQFQKERSIYTSNILTLPASPGKIVIFPSWLKHDVSMNCSNEVRITVAFNLMFEKYTEKMSIVHWEEEKQNFKD